MTSLISASSGLVQWFFNQDNKTTLNLETIRGARGDINEIRILLKGDVENCHRLFKQAVEERDVIVQIQLSYALFGMKWGKDDTKDFSSLVFVGT